MSTDDEPPLRWRMLAVMCAAELPAMSLWFTASAASAELAARWQLDLATAGWLTGAVQIGFVAGTALAALLNLADLIPARRYFAISAVVGAAVNAALVVAPGFATALVLRFLTGFCLAGVYPPAMKMIATWFRSGRGLAVGSVVGALTLGKATPYLVRALQGASLEAVVFASSAGALFSAVLITTVWRDGPFAFPRRPFSWGLVGTVLGHRETRLATGGYLGHMWELYAMWTWVPAFVGASIASRGDPQPEAVAWVAFGAIAAGAAGCVWGGRVADRIGRGRLVNLCMALSGACCLLIGLAFGGPLYLLAPLTWLWGFFVVADSAQFSTRVTEVAPPHAVGTALTLQTSIGFLLTLVTIQLVPWIANAVGWAWAFPILALGPAAGIGAILRLDRLRVRPAAESPEA